MQPINHSLILLAAEKYEYHVCPVKGKPSLFKITDNQGKNIGNGYYVNAINAEFDLMKIVEEKEAAVAAKKSK